MKKTFAFVLALALLLAFAGCTANGDDALFAKSEGTMSYADYDAAALDSEVVIETFVQAKQSWWEKDGQGRGTFYTQDKDGGYFLYEMPCTEEEYNKLVPGTKIRVKGYKAEWDGQVEVIDTTYEILEGTYTATAVDVTDKLGDVALDAYRNMFVAFKGMTVEAQQDAEGNEVAFLYSWDGSGERGNDLYFNVSLNGETYTFVVESYLTGPDTEVYQAVEALKVGDKVDMEGYLYRYLEDYQPHIVSVKVAE